MKRTIALLALAAICFGEAAPVFAHDKCLCDTAKMKSRKKPTVKKKAKDTTKKQF